MSLNFQIEFKKSNENLHIRPLGDFDGNSAWELINFLQQQYTGKGQVFIDTFMLREMCPFGCSIFQCRFKYSQVPANRLVINGKKGLEIAPKGSKVIVSPEKHDCMCSGTCTNCPCSKGDN